MKGAFSKIIYGVSWLVAALTGLATVLFIAVVVVGYPMYYLVFLGFITPCLGWGCLLFSVIPSDLLFLATRQRRDMCSFRMSGISLLALLGEAAILYYLAFVRH
jgi:hypothetical protein